MLHQRIHSPSSPEAAELEAAIAAAVAHQTAALEAQRQQTEQLLQDADAQLEQQLAARAELQQRCAQQEAALTRQQRMLADAEAACAAMEEELRMLRQLAQEQRRRDTAERKKKEREREASQGEGRAAAVADVFAQPRGEDEDEGDGMQDEPHLADDEEAQEAANMPNVGDRLDQNEQSLKGMALSRELAAASHEPAPVDQPRATASADSHRTQCASSFSDGADASNYTNDDDTTTTAAITNDNDEFENAMSLDSELHAAEEQARERLATLTAQLNSVRELTAESVAELQHTREELAKAEVATATVVAAAGAATHTSTGHTPSAATATTPAAARSPPTPPHSPKAQPSAEPAAGTASEDEDAFFDCHDGMSPDEMAIAAAVTPMAVCALLRTGPKTAADMEAALIAPLKLSSKTWRAAAIAQLRTLLWQLETSERVLPTLTDSGLYFILRA